MKYLVSLCLAFFAGLFLIPQTTFAAASTTPFDLNGNGTLDSDEAEVVVETDAVLPAGEYHFNNLTITNNATLTAQGDPNSSSAFKGVKITAASLTVTPGASLRADGTGYASGFGPGASTLWYVGASYGGMGIGNISTSTYGSATQPIDLGSGGACGTSCGGGALRLVIAGTLTNNGSVSANGGSSSSGGSLYVTAGTLTGNGTYSANGGDNTLVGCCYSSAGGGGRIAVYYQHSTFTGTTTALGGKSRGAYYFDPVSYAENGTIGFFDTTSNDLTVNSLWRFQANDSPFNFNKIILKNSSRTTAEAGASITANELLVDEGSLLTLSGGETLTLNKMTITGNSTITVLSEKVLSLTIPNLTITPGSSLNADGKGFGTGFGPGAPANQYFGASYGGVGIANTPESTYGSATAPTDFGSGSGACTPPSICGGGALRLIVTDTLANDGAISSNGGGSSSGGSVYVTANNITGSGIFSANGGNGSWLGCCYAGAGGGGRVAVYYENSTFIGTSTALGGKSQSAYYNPASYAGDGTVVFEHPSPTVAACCSSVAFLPGLEASRLYKPDYTGGTTRLWEPELFHDNSQLYLDASGVPTRSDIYTKDILDNAYVLAKGNIYRSFISSMDAMKTAGTINDWEALPYDWRLSPEEILNKGSKLPDGRLYYSDDLAATSTPYIIAEIRRLARGSQTGKVTIIAHSNGGLITKALADKLGSEASSLIDKIIFVAVPQVGTPQTVGAILHGFDQGIPKDWAPIFLSSTEARTFAKNMPGAYGLLPSAQYFTYTDDPAVTFGSSSLLAPWRTKYGDTIHSGERLHNFLADQSRTILPTDNPLTFPISANVALLNNAEILHNTKQDSWIPPQGVTLTEIAGWGEETVKTVKYYQGLQSVCTMYRADSTCAAVTSEPALLYDTDKVLDGDGTVLVPSALWTATSTGMGKYWVNLETYNGLGQFNINTPFQLFF